MSATAKDMNETAKRILRIEYEFDRAPTRGMKQRVLISKVQDALIDEEKIRDTPQDRNCVSERLMTILLRYRRKSFSIREIGTTREYWIKQGNDSNVKLSDIPSCGVTTGIVAMAAGAEAVFGLEAIIEPARATKKRTAKKKVTSKKRTAKKKVPAATKKEIVSRIDEMLEDQLSQKEIGMVLSALEDVIVEQFENGADKFTISRVLTLEVNRDEEPPTLSVRTHSRLEEVI